MTEMPASSSGSAYSRTASCEAASITASGFSAMSAPSEVTNGTPKLARAACPREGSLRPRMPATSNVAKLAAMLQNEARDDARRR